MIGADPSYVSAFFKAFLRSGSGSFIRGEGKTLEEAERKAFIQYDAEASCDHRYGRGSYRYGAGKCLKCDAFKADAFKPIVKLGEHRMPLTVADLYWFASGSGYASAKPDDSRHERWRRRKLLRARHFGLEIPDPPVDARFQERVTPSRRFRSYQESCSREVLNHLAVRLPQLVCNEEAAAAFLSASMFGRSEFRSLMNMMAKDGRLSDTEASSILDKVGA